MALPTGAGAVTVASVCHATKRDIAAYFKPSRHCCEIMRCPADCLGGKDNATCAGWEDYRESLGWRRSRHSRFLRLRQVLLFGCSLHRCGRTRMSRRNGHPPADGRGVSRGPRITIVSPPPTGGLVRSPVNLRLHFESFGGAKINAESVVITYKKVPPIDLTQRVTAFITSAGIAIPVAEVPPGTHVMFDCHGTIDLYCWDGGKTWVVEGELEGGAKRFAEATAAVAQMLLSAMRDRKSVV